MDIHYSYSVDVAYIDFSKAFDSVCHTKLTRKLESVGIVVNYRAYRPTG